MTEGRMGAADQGAGQVDGRWMVSARTLVFVRCGDRVLLMKRGPHKRIFPNRYNGLGGHIERDEDPYSSALREVHEESGLTATNLELRGVHHIDAGADSGILMFVFTADADDQAPLSHSHEGVLEWVSLDRVLGLDLVEDLPHTLDRILTMERVAAPYFAHVSYDADDRIVIRYA
ncbi:MAG: 8-oxo-dGTP diphosphatase [Chloroflexi bacterium]|nr:8-oxo-dGTP diphosphatase [Chloroflexota bacterium]